MTTATDRGFEIGKLYRVINDENSSYYKVGMIVRFSRDDGSNCPQFDLISGKPKSTVFNGLYYNGLYYVGLYYVGLYYIGLDDLEPVETQDNHEYSTNKPLLLLYIQQQYPNDKVLKALVESL